ncbi:hypothetical protein SAMN05428961_11358 [Paenibacillus sp. OK060]|nr:hypothetical protein SAMN05428961_11358 [Paenibacillus sp. OK060]
MNNGDGINGTTQTNSNTRHYYKRLGSVKYGFRTRITGGTVTKLEHYPHWSNQSNPTQVSEVIVKTGLSYSIHGGQVLLEDKNCEFSRALCLTQLCNCS